MLLALILFGLGTSSTATALEAQADDDAHLVVNGDFAAGAEGWRTNGPTQHLNVIADEDNQVAQLTTATNQTVVLNDRVNTVADTGPAGQEYVLIARVRTTTPIVNGALRVREVTQEGALSHQTSFWLPHTNWQDVELRVTTSRANAWLDINVVAWNLGSDQNVRINHVSMKEVDTAPAPAPRPEPVPQPGPAPGPDPAPGPEPAQGTCSGPLPSSTEFGASVYTVGLTTEQAIDDLDAAFGEVRILRIFSEGLPRAWDDDQARSFAGRSLVTSFRAHPSEINSGQYDDYFRHWFATAPDDHMIYWSYFHEPEPRIRDGVFTSAEYKQAWSRLTDLADEACRPNLFSTLILTDWTADPRSERELSTFDAGPDVIDVLAFDLYNSVHEPERDYYASPETLIDPILEMVRIQGDDRPWGVAELGSRIVPSDDGTDRAEWLTNIGQYVSDNDALFVTYFQSTRDGNWRLDDAGSRDAWRELVEATG